MSNISDRIKWGIISTGYVAHEFVQDFHLVKDAEIVAVASRSGSRARNFARKYKIPRWYGSYRELAQDPDIDVVYIGTPHVFHKENSLLCLENGKAVLCEKAFTINAREARELVSFARQKKLFLMEAMKTRFFPAVFELKKMLADQVIGEIKIISGQFGIFREYDNQHRLFNLELGGGALLDIGIYLISFGSMFFGKPVHVSGQAKFGKTGVDEYEIVNLEYDNGVLANFSISFQAPSPREATIRGTKRYLRLHEPLHRLHQITIGSLNGKEKTTTFPYTGKGFHYQATEVVNCLRAGKTESDIMPLDESVEIMETMDELRRQWGLKYPTES